MKLELGEEFFIRVNDFLAMADRIERRYDTEHALFAMLHAVSRYGAHHFRTVAKRDSESERVAFCNYLAGQVAGLAMNNLEQLSGPAAAAAAGDKPAE